MCRRGIRWSISSIDSFRIGYLGFDIIFNNTFFDDNHFLNRVFFIIAISCIIATQANENQTTKASDNRTSDRSTTHDINSTVTIVTISIPPNSYISTIITTIPSSSDVRSATTRISRP